jgi:PRTRC genetic system ParB family protein
MGSYKNLSIEDADNATTEIDAPTQAAAIESNPNATTNTIVTLPLDVIDTDFLNTRRRINQKEIDGLKLSINQVGLISALTVKALEGGRYSLVAGFKRFEALTQLNAKTVNAVVLTSDQDANVLEANVAENMVRSGLSLGEQSSAVKRLITTLEGDEENKIDQISVRLSMTKKAVKDRLILTALSEDGLAAFDDGKIALKSAIILAGLPQADQKENLDKMVAGTLTHEGLLEIIGKATIPLSLAKFDLTDCQQCPSNSQLQGSLFADPNEQSVDANCQNPSCFKLKSKTWYDARLVDLSETYGTIIPVSQVDRNEINPISEQVLGKSQLTQCGSCANNVNLIQNKVGTTFGDVVNNICNNKTCFTKCATSHAESIKVAIVQEETVVDEMQDAPLSSETTSPKPQAPKIEKPEPTQSASLSKPARESVRTALASVPLKTVLDDKRDLVMLSLLATLRLTKTATSQDIAAMQKALDMSADELVEFNNQLMRDYFKKALTETGDSNHERPVGSILLGLLNAKNQTDEAIVASWTIEQLKHATKAGIKAILIEAKFDVYYDEQQKKGAFNALMNAKAEDIHKALSSTDFDFTNFAPKAYIEYGRKVAQSVN